METKIQRLRKWLCRLICPKPKPLAPVIEVTRIVGTNKERIVYDGYDIEVEVYTDRIILSVFQNGKRLLKGWVFHKSDGHFVVDNSLKFHPNYKLRHFLREYAEKRLNENAEYNKD